MRSDLQRLTAALGLWPAFCCLGQPAHASVDSTPLLAFLRWSSADSKRARYLNGRRHRGRCVGDGVANVSAIVFTFVWDSKLAVEVFETAAR